jgi:4-amino-4-deoxy-L-arabinose transferase-like glycosyltransferase
MAQQTARTDVVAPAVPPGARADRRAWWLIAAAGVLAMLLRLPFVFTGLSTDEGGYAYVARQWARGARLYDTTLTGSAWLDRPQGLILTYRALLWINGSGWTIRVGVMLAGALISVALGVIGWQLAGRKTAVIAAFLYAIIGVAPHLEGMTLNGELLASVPATLSIAAILLWRRARGTFWLLTAGLLAGVSITMKQSGIDGLLVGLAVIAATADAWRPRITTAAAFLAAFATPVIACVIHGATLGLGKYWTALAGYQFAAYGGAGSNLGTRWHDFTRYLGTEAIDLVILIVVACLGLRPLSRFARTTMIVWVAAGFIGVNLGGTYWPHYYMQPLAPLALLAAVAVGSFTHRWVRATAAAALVLPTLIWLVALVPMNPHHRAKTIPYAALADRDDRIAAAITAQTTPNQRIYILVSEAYLYFRADREATYPYLWGVPIQKIPSAIPLMHTMLSSPDRPTLVIMDTKDADTVDPSGGIARDLMTYYHFDEVVDGVTILRAN